MRTRIMLVPLWALLLVGGAACKGLVGKGKHIRATDPPLSLAQAAEQGLVRYALDWTAPGVIHEPFGRRLRLRVHNLSRRPVRVVLEAGRRLQPVGPVGESLVVLQPWHAELPPRPDTALVVWLQAAALNMAPLPASGPLALGPLPTDAVQQVARLFAELGHYGAGAQAAIWALADGLPVHLVEGPNAATTERLRRALAWAVRKPAPEHAPEPFFQSAKHVTSTFRYFTPKPLALTLEVVPEAEGAQPLVLWAERMHNPGEHAERIEIPRAELPPGNYALRLRHGPKVLRLVGFVVR